MCKEEVVDPFAAWGVMEEGEGENACLDDAGSFSAEEGRGERCAGVGIAPSPCVKCSHSCEHGWEEGGLVSASGRGLGSGRDSA